MKKMGKEDNDKPYDLEERTERFARRCRELVRKLPRSITNIDDVRQLVRASGSVGANYIEANEAISKKDFVHRIKICRKESKESRMWLRLIYTDDSPGQNAERDALVQEATELMNIMSAIMRKFE
jgi:four helix bundle protein